MSSLYRFTVLLLLVAVLLGAAPVMVQAQTEVHSMQVTIWYKECVEPPVTPVIDPSVYIEVYNTVRKKRLGSWPLVEQSLVTNGQYYGIVARVTFAAGEKFDSYSVWIRPSDPAGYIGYGTIYPDGGGTYISYRIDMFKEYANDLVLSGGTGTDRCLGLVDSAHTAEPTPTPQMSSTMAPTPTSTPFAPPAMPTATPTVAPPTLTPTPIFLASGAEELFLPIVPNCVQNAPSGSSCTWN